MKNFSTIDKQIAYLLKQMGKAMPEVRRQVEVYEKNLKSVKIKTPKIGQEFKHV